MQPELYRCSMVVTEHPDVWLAVFLKAGPGSDQERSKPALIILNQPIADTTVLGRLWSHTSYHLCADGGANQLYDLFANNQPSQLDQYVRCSVMIPGMV